MLKQIGNSSSIYKYSQCFQRKFKSNVWLSETRTGQFLLVLSLTGQDRIPGRSHGPVLFLSLVAIRFTLTMGAPIGVSIRVVTLAQLSEIFVFSLQDQKFSCVVLEQIMLHPSSVGWLGAFLTVTSKVHIYSSTLAIKCTRINYKPNTNRFSLVHKGYKVTFGA